ncbi:hypothetical protein RB195_022721 [Necator americanus]|uniref:Ig-like domain-containing protein n=1 Tax=Necator americanus TaxID=51031 RepID=A0ABR1EGF6_NECAM
MQLAFLDFEAAFDSPPSSKVATENSLRFFGDMLRRQADHFVQRVWRSLSCSSWSGHLTENESSGLSVDRQFARDVRFRSLGRAMFKDRTPRLRYRKLRQVVDDISPPGKSGEEKRRSLELAVGRPEQAYCRVVVITKPRTSITTPLRLSAMVDQNNNGTLFGHPDPPQLVFPSKENRPDSPIVVDVVVGQDIILECVFVRAKIVWTKVGKLSSRISLTDDEARLRQIWGNLRIRQVSQGRVFKRIFSLSLSLCAGKKERNISY